MTCKVIAEWYCKPGKGKDFVEFMKVALPKTRALEDNLQIDLSVDEDYPSHLFMTQEWTSSQAHKDYVIGLKEAGVWPLIMDFMAAHPNFTWCELTDA